MLQCTHVHSHPFLSIIQQQKSHISVMLISHLITESNCSIKKATLVFKIWLTQHGKTQSFFVPVSYFTKLLPWIMFHIFFHPPPLFEWEWLRTHSGNWELTDGVNWELTRATETLFTLFHFERQECRDQECSNFLLCSWYVIVSISYIKNLYHPLDTF